MSIQKDKNGWMVQYSYFDPIAGKEKRTKKRGFRTKAEAKYFEKSLTTEKSSVLFYTLYKEYQDSLEQSDNTRHEKDALIDKYVPGIKSQRFENLTKPFLLKLRTEISNLNLSAVRKNKILSLIKSACKYANDIYDLPDNSKVMKTFKKKKPKMEIWSMDEYLQFEENVSEKYKPFFRLIYFTGLRKGEAKALLTDDLNIENGTITVDKAMRRDISSLKAPKTASSVRKVQLDAITLEMLKPLKSHEKWLFGDYKPFTNSSIDVAFRNGIKKAGIKKIRIHDLRHSHCSYLIGNGIDVVSVANRLGHSSITTTLQTYSHALENADNKIVDFLNEQQKN